MGSRPPVGALAQQHYWSKGFLTLLLPAPQNEQPCERGRAAYQGSERSIHENYKTLMKDIDAISECKYLPCS